MKREDELSKLIIGAAIEVHKQLGLGCWNQLMKNAWRMNSDFDRFLLRDKNHFQ